MTGAFILILVYTYYYTDRETADIFKYFDDSKIMFDALKSKPVDFFKMFFGIANDNEYFNIHYYDKMNYWYFLYNQNDVYSDSHVMIRLNVFLRFLSFGYYPVHAVLMTFFSYSGLISIFKFFSNALSLLKSRLLFIGISILPSIVFWTSGVIKEALVLGMIGLFLFSFQNIKRNILLKSLLLLCSLLVMYYLKFYVFIAFVVAFAPFAVNLKLKKPLLINSISIVFFVVSFIVLNYFSNDSILNLVQLKQESFFQLAKNNTVNSFFNIPEIHSVFDIFKYAPNALYNALLRPNIFSFHSLFELLSGIENSIVFLILIIALFYIKKAKINNPYFLFASIFITLLFSIIGLTVPIAGAIVRYKTPALPFLIFIIVYIINIDKIAFLKFLKQ
ncbi:MAG: hypothetical protein Kow0079_07000 [Vicingaceae bacterium]